MYSALEVAKYVVSKCTEEKRPISNLQLQKILYYIQRTYIKQGSRAFEDDIEAWQFGPVVPDVYYYFCGFGAMPITANYMDVQISQYDKGTINPIVEEKRKLKPWDLVEDTHRPGGAWDSIYRGGLGNKQVIPVSAILKEA